MIVESGNLSNQRDRLGLIASILSGLGYDAVGVGETDLRTFGADFFKELAENKLAVLDASVDAPKSTLPYLVKNVDGVKVGVVSFGASNPDANVNEYVRRKALYTAFKAARGASDILVVLDQANLITREWLERNGSRFGVPDIVIAGTQRMSQPQEEIVGKTHIMPTSIQGKHVGVVDVDLAQGQEPKFTVQRIALEENVAEDEAIARRVKTFAVRIQPVPNVAQYQPDPTAMQETVAANEKSYYPPMLCRVCHLKQYDDWKTTKHASAIKTLNAQQRAIPECMKCHSEMFRRLQRMSVTPEGIGGVECATCHLNSLPHGMERRNVTARAKVDPKSCVECHSKEWSPKYDEKAYLANVSHSGAAATTAVSPAPAATPLAPAGKPSERPLPPMPPLPPRPPAVK